jgi:hypothetical protein
MTTTDWIGFIGVTILLVAYFLNLNNLFVKEGPSYMASNLLGAGLACLASVRLHYVPFIILEGAWAGVSLYSLIQYFRRG